MSGKIVYHMAQKSLWEEAGEEYTPPTYQQDGFVHATEDSAMLLGIANHFYKETKGEWILLKLSVDKLKHKTVWEAPAPVGDKSSNLETEVKMPHIYGPINKDAVDKITSIQRDEDGSFLSFAT
mmetsp:Transcript_34958/g.54641  ORF Transcript_34958/g.54641 Transcript_34958/m.54641 type:complete len:124 (-) Transcript_34958:2683-3054(-)